MILFKRLSNFYCLCRTRGDVNCLYRACSKVLSGKEDLHSLLRGLTSIELFSYPQFYSLHPYLKEKADVFESDNMVFSAAASDVALGDGYDRHDKTSRSQVVTREAIRNASNCCYSSLLCMFALSSVTGMKVRSVYPDTLGETSKYSKFLNGQILPRVEHSLFVHQNWSFFGQHMVHLLCQDWKRLSKQIILCL